MMIHLMQFMMKINRYKVLRTWAQCFIAGIREVIFGFRNEDGIIKSVESFPTRKLYRLSANPEWVNTAVFSINLRRARISA